MQLKELIKVTLLQVLDQLEEEGLEAMAARKGLCNLVDDVIDEIYDETDLNDILEEDEEYNHAD